MFVFKLTGIQNGIKPILLNFLAPNFFYKGGEMEKE